MSGPSAQFSLAQGPGDERSGAIIASEELEMKTAGWVLLALSVAAPLLSADESYTVRLARPKKVGDTYRLDARGMHHTQQRLTVGGRLVGEEDKKHSVHLVAVATVLAVDTKSSATRIEYRIESLRASSPGQSEEEVLPAGRKVVAESKNGDTAFTTDSAVPLTPETVETLKMVISAHVPESPTDDDIFGTTARKKVGDRWGINAATAARDLAKSGLSVSAEDLNGSVHLAGVREAGGVKALQVSGQLRSDKIGLAAPQAGVQVEKTLMEGEFSGLVPADPESRVLLSDSFHMRFSAQMGSRKADTGEKITVDISMEMSLENSFSPAKAEAQSLSITDAPRIASASISTSISGAMSFETSTIVDAGRMFLKISPWARPIASHWDMSVT